MMRLQGSVGNYIYLHGKSYSYFGGNNYLGLANHPAVKEAALQAIQRYGVNFAASRHTTGTSVLHEELEKVLSVFKNSEASVCYASGYLGNGILLHLFQDRYETVLMDQYVHPSISGNIPREIPVVQRYRHLDLHHLESLLQQYRTKKPLIISDGVFALTGEIAPVDQLYALASRFNALLIIDDAHATGVLGEHGRGTPEYFNLPAGDIVQTETMSKALGAYGGFISGNGALIGAIRQRSPQYQASTALPPSLAAAGLASVNLIMDNPGWRTRLLERSASLKKEIAILGYQTTMDPTPIIPLMFPGIEQAKSLSAFFKTEGIIAPYMDYPVDHSTSIVRLTVSAQHTDEQIENLLDLLNNWKKHHGTNENQKSTH